MMKIVSGSLPCALRSVQIIACVPRLTRVQAVDYPKQGIPVDLIRNPLPRLLIRCKPDWRVHLKKHTLHYGVITSTRHAAEVVDPPKNDYYISDKALGKLYPSYPARSYRNRATYRFHKRACRAEHRLKPNPFNPCCRNRPAPPRMDLADIGISRNRQHLPTIRRRSAVHRRNAHTHKARRREPVFSKGFGQTTTRSRRN